MNATKTGVTANIIGILVLVLAMFGIDLDEQSQKVLIGAAGVIGLIINQVLIAWAQRQEPAKPDNKLIPDIASNSAQPNGFARIECLWLALGLCAALVAACNINPPQTTRQSLLAAYAATATAANSIEIAKRDGHIDAAQRDALLNQVKQARALLNDTRNALTNDPAPGSANDTEALKNLHLAQNILLAIQAALPKESSP